MAGALVKEELICLICVESCIEPVYLPCGHSFCRTCTIQELDTQGKFGIYSCWNCNVQFAERPVMLHKRRRLTYRDTVPCTYCTEGCVPAEKTCLHCDASLCAQHLRRHSSAAEHVLVKPTMHPRNRKCREHGQLLGYYCTDDDAFLCLFCFKSGDHEEHEVVTLNTITAEDEETKLGPILRTLKRERKTIETRIDGMQDAMAKQSSKTSVAKKRVIGQIQKLKKELDHLQSTVEKEVSTLGTWVLCAISNNRNKLKNQRQEMSDRISSIEELQKIKDPLAFLKRIMETDLVGIFNIEQDPISQCLLDEAQISQSLHKGLLRFADGLIKGILVDGFPKMKKSEIRLDVKTAHCNIAIADALATAVYTSKRQNKDPGPERFRTHHVLSECDFSSGIHYWEVKVKGAESSVGMAYSTIDRKSTKHDAKIGCNTKSWSLRVDGDLSAWHNNVEVKIEMASPVHSFGVFLEYEAGCLSFYQLCDPIKHLHTFHATFTESLHAAFHLDKESTITILR